MDAKNKHKTKMTTHEKMELVFEYCNVNNKCPKYNTVYKNVEIGEWFRKQKPKISSEEDDLYIKCAKNKHIRKSFDEYLFNKRKIKLSFDDKMQLLFEYCNVNKNCPRYGTLYQHLGIGSWLTNQKGKISSKEDDLYIKLAKNQYVKKSLDTYLCNKNKNKNKKKID
eukprot:163366_1